jgi:UDP-N-acetylmuramyl pentapeptide synthase
MKITINIETAMAHTNRCDITVQISINGKQHLLVIEVKGQWHKDLYTAAKCQLFERYSIHPNAAQQGIYLVLWFGKSVDVAERKKHNINNVQELYQKLKNSLPTELKGRIDIFVLNLSI